MASYTPWMGWKDARDARLAWVGKLVTIRFVGLHDTRAVPGKPKFRDVSTTSVTGRIQAIIEEPEGGTHRIGTRDDIDKAALDAFFDEQDMVIQIRFEGGATITFHEDSDYVTVRALR